MDPWRPVGILQCPHDVSEPTAATLRISDGDPHMAGCDPKPLRDGQHPHTFSAFTSNGSRRGRAALGSDDGGVINAHANAHGGVTNAHGGVVVPPPFAPLRGAMTEA